LLEALGHPERHFASIHVGGTNGKGSVCAFIAAELEAQGFRVGVYSSPHLISPSERVTVNGAPISEDAFVSWTDELRPHIERTDASFFEAMTAMAFADFAARGVDIAVVEVGLGGRLDATNVISPLVTVVTKVALEHTDYLGTDLRGIAREKAGIAKPGVPFVTGEMDADLRAELVFEAKDHGAGRVIEVNTEGLAADVGRLGLRGSHQWGNAWLALAALNELPPPFERPGEALPESFARAYLPGRLDVQGRWIFDVAHNPDGMMILVAALRELKPHRPLQALVGIRRDKDWKPMLAALQPEVDRILLTVAPSVPGEQRWKASDFAGQPFMFEPRFDQALAEIERGAETVLVTGSFHTVGDAMARLGVMPYGLAAPAGA
jgi:dihydrofolate synthase/folylpolyglutamate synthase